MSRREGKPALTRSEPSPSLRADEDAAEPGGPGFDDRFEELFQREYPRLFRFLDRLSGEVELAADLAQEAFLRLYRRGSMPDAPAAWLVTAAMNLFRNERSTARRRHRLLTPSRAEHAQSDPPRTAEQALAAEAARRRVRRALDALPERDRQLLLLRAEGFSYREMAEALDLHEASVGTLLARARQAFRETYGRSPHAS